MSVGFNIGAKRTIPKPYINIGAMLDIPTGPIVTGNRGEKIINGGAGPVIAIAGHGNSYKSTLLHYITLSASNKISSAATAYMMTYDAELNISFDRLNHLAKPFEYIPNDPVTYIIENDETFWSVIDKSSVTGEELFDMLAKYSDTKAKASKTIELTAFKNPYDNGTLKIITPTFIEIDSLTELEDSKTDDMIEGDIGGSGSNMAFARDGLFKTKFVKQLPKVSGKSNTYMLMTAHTGQKLDLASGPAMYAPKPKKLQYLKGDDVLKGVSGKFSYLTNTLWYVGNTSKLNNQGTKEIEYPRDKDDHSDKDLNLVTLIPIRNKNGASGVEINIVVSQADGVLPTLSEFHYIKSTGRFGIDGNNTSYNIIFKPEVKINRNTIRGLIDTDPKLCRAINIASELLQLQTFQPHLQAQGLMCTPQELYDDLIKAGYDWDVLLNTRGYWLPDQYNAGLPFLSTIDLLYMRAGLYIPYWMNEDKSIKKEYQKHFEGSKDGKKEK